MKEAAAWLAERLEGERAVLPARAGAARAAAGAAARAAGAGTARARRCGCSRSSRPRCRSAHMALRFPPVVAVPRALPRAAAAARARFDFDSEVVGLSRVEQAVAFLALLELRKAGEIALEQAAPFAPIRVSRAGVERKEPAWIVRSA